MNWQKQLTEYETKKEWDKAISLMNNAIAFNSSDKWLYIHVIYLFHNILLEEDYPEDKQEELARLLQKYFEESRLKFSEDSEYLFFIGKLLHIAEWYFGLEDNRLAFEFQKKAMEKEPSNLLYEWAYRFSCQGDIVEGYLAHQIIEYDKDKVDWLRSKGFCGVYVLEHLQMSNERYVQTKATD